LRTNKSELQTIQPALRFLLYIGVAFLEAQKSKRNGRFAHFDVEFSQLGKGEVRILARSARTVSLRWLQLGIFLVFALGVEIDKLMGVFCEDGRRFSKVCRCSKIIELVVHNRNGQRTKLAENPETINELMD
jgi:hypothetical protein